MVIMRQLFEDLILFVLLLLRGDAWSGGLDRIWRKAGLEALFEQGGDISGCVTHGEDEER